jgi:2-polyprenyl-3-methyl-5-hydroxy-6-metoxy-1,4-benzoquinol methylase
MNSTEKKMQEKYPWDRNKFHSSYNNILAHYQAISCLENSSGESLLDLACGDGTMTKMFSEKFKRIVGVDASGTHLSKAKERLPSVEFHESLIEDFATSEKFDSVFLLMVLEHVQDPIELIKVASSFLKENGTLIIHVPNANAINRKIAVKMGTLKTCDELSPFDIDIAGHRRSYTLETLSEDVKKAGLKVKSTGGIFYKMLSTPQIDWFLKNGEWNSGHGWGRTGVENVDWEAEFCRACYEIGKERPEDCNVIYVCVTK